MSSFILEDHPHRRYNALSGEWVLVSPHRAKRPWQGQVEKGGNEDRPEYDPKCYLCPGNDRINGTANPEYKDTYVFQNDFGALITDTPSGTVDEGMPDLFKAESEKGICRVICFSPRHDLTLPEMELPAIEKVVQLWKEQYEELSKLDFINHIQIFENKGAVMGCSNPHPHGQIWAQQTIPGEVQQELIQQEAYFKKNKSILLLDYVNRELELKTRIVFENESFVALVPFWATWPFEMMILPKRKLQHLGEFTSEDISNYADILKKLTICYDNLFETSFPYSAGIHQLPTDDKNYVGLQMHMHFYPPLLRSATVKKFMVGYEMLGEAQRDITPETSAQRLRDLPTTHYKSN
ncbi:UDP-glucose--hexose-1-phosphate uridylyltransferase [Chondrinema litorale]|uniref:UDP-glucose--hexose-1-phosphate uridylyltransferase n=1 Tax=Chondrinema litorale TaxID=2994555 RepID=UPI0025445307|nr:UDP-glucose--hexose-1-phosphate uridylyltransferase [Chondrinema litorale]UZR93238.1 UDP-glucose--hexose-1-phosphate uridylyltransferase [Chondrinema litorale]